MSSSIQRPRTHPADRFADDERLIDLADSLRKLRTEISHTDGHRQIALMHEGPVRLVLYAFQRGGSLPEHRAPAWVTIHVLRGAVEIHTEKATHQVGEGKLLVLVPDTLHDVKALTEADMLLAVYPDEELGSESV